MSPIRRRTALRWLAPLLTAALFVGGGFALSAWTNAAHADLAPRSAARLLVDVQNARVAGLSGTIVQTANLGLPDIPGVGGGGSSNLSSLVAGSHTLRVWYAGPEHVRLALLGQFGESDVIRNGADLWIWSSKDHSASHSVISSHGRAAKADPTRAPTDLPKTPQQAADAALKAITPTTTVRADRSTVVAGRPAYLLELQPKSADTTVGSVQIAIDGATHVPTRVQVFPRGSSSAAFSVGFTSFDPSTPSASVFGFNPPPGTKVTQGNIAQALTGRSGDAGTHGNAKPEPGTPGSTPATTHEKPKVVGDGWSAVVVAPAAGVTSGTGSGPLAGMLRNLPKVSGTWGSGRLLQGTLFSVLLTDDGRIAAGAVSPSLLYAALATP